MSLIPSHPCPVWRNQSCKVPNVQVRRGTRQPMRWIGFYFSWCFVVAKTNWGAAAQPIQRYLSIATHPVRGSIYLANEQPAQQTEYCIHPFFTCSQLVFVFFNAIQGKDSRMNWAEGLITHKPTQQNRMRFIEKRDRQWIFHPLRRFSIGVLIVQRVRFPSLAPLFSINDLRLQ